MKPEPFTVQDGPSLTALQPAAQKSVFETAFEFPLSSVQPLHSSVPPDTHTLRTLLSGEQFTEQDRTVF